jgi:hypothetical protein
LILFFKIGGFEKAGIACQIDGSAGIILSIVIACLGVSV